jgi:hypothetical protein
MIRSLEADTKSLIENGLRKVTKTLIKFNYYYCF